MAAGRRITISTGKLSAQAELNESPCASAILKALPVEAQADTWGDEVYFDIGVRCGLEKDAREDMAVGELGYWPSGRSLCVFFGPTPASDDGGPPRAASKVNPVGKIIGPADAFRKVRDGDKIVVSAGE
jgi:hypothetical protein